MNKTQTQKEHIRRLPGIFDRVADRDVGAHVRFAYISTRAAYQRRRGR